MAALLAQMNWADYGIAGLCLAMLFYLLFNQLSAGTKAINNNTAALERFAGEQREFKQAMRQAPCGEWLKELEAEKRVRLEQE